MRGKSFAPPQGFASACRSTSCSPVAGSTSGRFPGVALGPAVGGGGGLQVAAGRYTQAINGDTMAGSYMPDKQDQAVAWSQNFATKIESDFATYGLTAVQSSAFQTVNNELQAAFLATQNPDLKSKVAVRRKNTALAAMKAMARNLVSIVQGTSTVSAAQKDSLGVTVRSTTRQAAQQPTQAPFLKVLDVSGRTIIVELQQGSSRRGRPAKVAAATVFTHQGADVPM